MTSATKLRFWKGCKEEICNAIVNKYAAVVVVRQVCIDQSCPQSTRHKILLLILKKRLAIVADLRAIDRCRPVGTGRQRW